MNTYKRSLKVTPPPGYRFLFSCIGMSETEAREYCKRTFHSARNGVICERGVWRMKNPITYSGWYFDPEGGYTAFVPV